MPEKKRRSPLYWSYVYIHIQFHIHIRSIYIYILLCLNSMPHAYPKLKQSPQSSVAFSPQLLASRRRRCAPKSGANGSTRPRAALGRKTLISKSSRASSQRQGDLLYFCCSTSGWSEYDWLLFVAEHAHGSLLFLLFFVCGVWRSSRHAHFTCKGHVHMTGRFRLAVVLNL